MHLKIKKHFRKKDKILFSIIEKIEPIKKIQASPPNTYFIRLCRDIICQQLSGKAGQAIFSRFKKLYLNQEITPSKIIKTPHKTLRAAGLSNAKARYLKNLSKKLANEELQFHNYKNLDNEQIIKELILIKGIGRWTAEMFLMFTLAREDVFSHGDLGLRKAVKKLYEFKKEPSKEEIENLSGKWSPYRTYACFILWRSLDI